jgi:hypothetical protein
MSPAIGAAPDDPAARLGWQGKAATIGAYRELSAHGHPDDTTGPEPGTGSAEIAGTGCDAYRAESALFGLSGCSRDSSPLAVLGRVLAERPASGWCVPRASAAWA